MGDFSMIWMKLWNCETAWPFWSSFCSVLISLFVYPPLNQSPVSQPASCLLPCIHLILSFSCWHVGVGTPGCGNCQIARRPPGLAWHHHFCFWHIQPRAITLTVCHSPSLNLSLSPSLPKSLSFSPPSHLPLLYLSSSPAFFSRCCPLSTFVWSSPSHPCRTLSLPINPYIFLLSTPEIDKCFTFTLQYHLSLPALPHPLPHPNHTPLYRSHTLWSIALTWQRNNNSSQTFVRLQCTVVFSSQSNAMTNWI